MSKGEPELIGGLSFKVPVPPGRESRYFNVGDEVELDPARIDLFEPMFAPSGVEMLRNFAASSMTGSIVGHIQDAGYPELCRVAFVNGPQLAVPHDFLKRAHA